MNTYENIPSAWFTSDRRERSSYHSARMSRPVSKSFNRISDFIFPDTIHIRFSPPPPPPLEDQSTYERIENVNSSVVHRQKCYPPDLIIVERLSAAELDNIDLLYRERNHQNNRQLRRRYSSILDDRYFAGTIPPSQPPSQPATPSSPPTKVATRSAAFREKIRDRRKRHTMDNVYHSMLRTMIDSGDEQQSNSNGKHPSFILSYRTTLDPITDSESMTSIPQQQNTKETSHGRVPINGTLPTMCERRRSKHRLCSSTISSHDTSSDTDMTDRQTLTMNSSFVNSSETSRTLWKRLTRQTDECLPMSDSDNNFRLDSSPSNNELNSQKNNSTLSKGVNHVSVCVNDLHTTLFIDEETLNDTKTPANGGKVLKTFIDRIIKRLQHFKRSLDHGLIHVRKRNTLNNGSIITTNYRSCSEAVKRKSDLPSPWSNTDENRYVQPYFLIKPQTVLMLPTETAKFKCCFGGDPHPTIFWSHNGSRIGETFASHAVKSSRYRLHKLHDIHYLDIDSVTLRDNGQVKCTIMNTHGREEVIVQLLVVPSPADATPSITRLLSDVTVNEGESVKLSCIVKGPQVTVDWFHNGKLISTASQAKDDYYDEEAVFSFSCCMRNDAGSIDCLVKNRFGEARTSCRIEVVNDFEFDR
ncbi:unnamed protein product [Adineta ricciae]|uniref:Ig-like domain-containing protein n=1 Tax=Adineta ricciae TaxID=249248 RepID=A0A813W5Y0_ADIRI|nr:unnamed protein product [Adineta ricciae]